MFGYVTVIKDHLTEQEQDVYRGYYCGVCKALGKRHGQPSRMVLNYDAAFLALLLESLEEEEEELVREHCMIHPIQNNPVIQNSKWIDFSSDMMILLAYQNFVDDKKDEHPIRGRAGEGALRKPYRKVAEKYTEIAALIEEKIGELRKLEQEKSPSLDLASMTSGEMMKAIFSWGREGTDKQILEEIGYSIGVWVYLIDALDDYRDDAKSGAYNPLVYRKAGLEGLEPLIYDRLSRITNGIDLLEIKKNKGIIDNVVLMGMRAQTDRVLQKISEGKEEI